MKIRLKSNIKHIIKAQENFSTSVIYSNFQYYGLITLYALIIIRVMLHQIITKFTQIINFVKMNLKIKSRKL